MFCVSDFALAISPLRRRFQCPLRRRLHLVGYHCFSSPFFRTCRLVAIHSFLVEYDSLKVLTD